MLSIFTTSLDSPLSTGITLIVLSLEKQAIDFPSGDQSIVDPATLSDSDVSCLDSPPSAGIIKMLLINTCFDFHCLAGRRISRITGSIKGSSRPVFSKIVRSRVRLFLGVPFRQKILHHPDFSGFPGLALGRKGNFPSLGVNTQVRNYMH